VDVRVLTRPTEIWKLPGKRAAPGGFILCSSMPSRSPVPRSASVVTDILLLAQHSWCAAPRGAGSP